MKIFMNFKKFAALTLCLGISAGVAFAADPFRQHRYESLKATPADNVDVMFVGNSITHMHEWWEAYGCVQTISGRGNSGGLASEVLENLESFIDGKPKKLFLMIGTNDIKTNGTEAIADLTARRIRAVIKRIKAESPETEIYIESILPRQGMNGSIAKANAQIKGYCEELGAHYIDLDETMKLLPNDAAWSLDGLHPQIKGYSAWTHFIEPQVGYNSVYPPADDITEIKTANDAGVSHRMRIGQFSYLPVKQGDVLIFGDEAVHAGEWHELLGSPKVKDRGTGWGYSYINFPQAKVIVNAALDGQAEQPSAIILNYGEGGTNSDNYRAIVNEARRLAPNAKIFCMSLTPRTSASDDADVNNRNAFIKSAAEALGVGYIDIYTPLAANRGKFIMNGNYLSGQGYAVIANEIAKALEDPDLTPISLESAEALIARRNNRAIVGNMLTDAFMTDVAEGQQAALDLAVDEAVAALDNDITEARAREVAAKLEAAIMAAKGYVVPTLSTDAETHWYVIRSVRQDRVATSSGGNLMGLTEGPSADTTVGNNVWKLMDRGDGTFDVVNMLGEYVSAQGVANNSGLKVTTEAPAGGWEFSKSNYNGYSYVIYSDAAGNAQWNQANTGTFPVLNWHPAGTYPILNDEGSSYYFTEYFGELIQPELSTGWFQIAVKSGISNLGDANRMLNADEEKRQNATNFYALMYGPEQTEYPAKEFIHITVDGLTGPYHFTGLNGHGVQENCTSSRVSVPTDNPAVTQVSNGVYTIGKWHIWENYVGKSSGSDNTFTIRRVSDDVLDLYDLWSVEIIAADHTEVGKDVRVTLDNAANKGISTVFNGGTYFLTKGAEIKPEQLSFIVENTQVLSEPYVVVDNAAKIVSVNFNEEPSSTIAEIKVDAAGNVYDLQGRRVVNPVNGLYIVDGKLVRK